MAVMGMLTAGEVVAFSAYLVMLKTPLVYTGYLINLYQRAKSSSARVDGIMGQPGEASVMPPADRSISDRSTPVANADIVIKNITFTYPGERRRALDGISLRLPHGSTTAIVGPVGSGKSTLLHLIARIQEPPPGTIFLGGSDIAGMPLERRSTDPVVPGPDPIAPTAPAPFGRPTLGGRYPGRGTHSGKALPPARRPVHHQAPRRPVADVGQADANQCPLFPGRHGTDQTVRPFHPP